MSCAAKNHTRVLVGRHDEPCTDPSCTGCLPCTEPHCHTCRRDHAEVTCTGCLAMARDHLTTIGFLTTHLRDEAVHGSRSLRAETPGGNALVLLSPGNYTGTLSPRDERRNDPRPVHVVLDHWVHWYATNTDTTHDLPQTLGAAVDRLGEVLHLLARDPVFPQLARDLSRTRRQLEDVLYDGDRPEVSRVPCWDCGTRLHKVYGEHPAQDHWRCPRCGEHYDRGRYDRAKHDHLASRGADRYVPVSMAVAAIGRPEQTVRAWIRRGLVTVQRDPNTGRVLAWWPDVRTAHLLTARRKRRTISR